MSVFMAFALGVIFGALLGGIGMFLTIKEVRLDEDPVFEVYVGGEPVAHCKAAPELNWEELDMPQEVKYGEF